MGRDGSDVLVLHRTFTLSPRQGALLGMIWIAIQKSRGNELGAVVETKLLRDLVLTAQDRGLVDREVLFWPSETYQRGWGAPDLQHALQFLKEADLLYIPEPGDTVSFLGKTLFDLPTGIFRHINVFGFAALVDEFTGGERGQARTA